MARPNPNSRSRDMIISLGVLLVPILLIVWFFTSNPEAKPEPVDVRDKLSRAEAESPYPVLRATNLPDGWVPVRVAWAKAGSPWLDDKPADSNIWLLGYLGPDGIYYGVQQSDSAADIVERATRQGKPTGEEVQAAGRTWQGYESLDGRTRSLVSRQEGVTSVVSADTSGDAVRAFAETLTTG